MAPKKKDAPSSSDSSSSNSSSSSTSSSSSSGSESSSSDTENSSTSGAKSANPSSDSDKKPAQKKKSSTISTRSKTDSLDGNDNKNKEKPKKQQSSKTVYSSDSEDSSPKINTKRKPQPKPKSSATVTPVSKNSKSTPTKNAPKKLNPPRKAAQKASGPQKNSPKTAPPSKADDSKKNKTKSIFSPDNTTDSEDTTPPPKLTAMKTAATKGQKNKPKAAMKSRSSSISSNSSVSSRSSRSSSGSNRDSSRSKQDSGKKKRVSRRDKKPSPLPPQLVSDVENVPTTRKLTRSLSTRKSKHVVRVQSESDSDTGSKTSITKSPVKKAPKESIFQRKLKIENEEEHQPRKCIVEGCDSSGHLSGRHSKHFTIEACPVYHNLTPQQCKEFYQERLKREEEQKKAVLSLKNSRTGSPTPETKAYKDKVKELKSRSGSGSGKEEESEPGKERQPPITKYGNKYDLRLFQDAQAMASESIEEELKLLANVRYTKLIEMGKFEMEVWYQSPYPDDFARLPKLYICEYCLRYLKARKSMERHAAKCIWRHPPGEEVYRKEKISVWEVDGKRYKSYCQNLCLLAKFFLDHKTLYYDVEPFLFYVMTISDSEGCHTVGYFSKEKNSFLNYNVSCILTLPPYQRQGYGRLLIDFSYLLTRVENKIGSPEKPLSDLGLISYRSYWKDVLLDYLCNLEGKQISIKDISQEMAINSYDIVSTLQALGMMKYWKGKHIILKKQDVIEEYVERSKRRGVTYKEIDPACLKWTPFVPPSTPNSSA